MTSLVALFDLFYSFNITFLQGDHNKLA